ncbi:MAG: glycosyltransferase family 2 protein [Bryobacteraceae bacterium]
MAVEMVGIVIVTYNSEDVIGECLDACLRVPGASVVVVDNHSLDATADIIRRRSGVRLIANSENWGFAAGCNQGIAALETRFVLLLNPDAVLVSGLEPLIAAVSQASVAAAGGRLLNADGTTQTGFHVRGFPTAWTLCFETLGFNRLWPGNWVNRTYRPEIPDEQLSLVDQPAGAFLMIRRAAWELVGGFDEGFQPVWFEDVDFCKRLRQRGFRIVHVPAAAARHLGGHSAGKLTWPSRQLYWYGSLLRYAAKHFSASSSRIVSLAVAVSCIPRAIAGVLYHRTLTPVSVFSRVAWLAGRHFIAGPAGAPVAPERGFAHSAVSSQVVEKHV